MGFRDGFLMKEKEEALLFTKAISLEPIRLFISTDRYSFLFPLAKVFKIVFNICITSEKLVLFGERPKFVCGTVPVAFTTFLWVFELKSFISSENIFFATSESFSS